MEPNPYCYSATVRISLIIDGESLSVHQLGPNFAILKHPRAIPPTHAELRVRIDDHETRRIVFLPDGAQLDQPTIRLTAG